MRHETLICRAGDIIFATHNMEEESHQEVVQHLRAPWPVPPLLFLIGRDLPAWRMSGHSLASCAIIPCVISLLFRPSKQTSIAQEKPRSYSQKGFSQEDFEVDPQWIEVFRSVLAGSRELLSAAERHRETPCATVPPLPGKLSLRDNLNQRASACRKASTDHSHELTLFLKGA